MSGKRNVTIGLKADGLSEVKSAIKGVRQSLVDMETDGIAATKSASEKRLAILKSEATQRKKLASEASSKVDEGTRRMRGLPSGGGSRVSATGTNTNNPVMESLIKGEGMGGMMKAAGAAGLAIGILKGGIDLATASLKQFASFVINDVIKPAMELETRAVQVANSSGGQLTANEVESKARAAGVQNNIDPMKMVEAAGVFQDATGDAKLAFEMLNTLGTLSKSRGFDMGELTNMAGALYKPGMKKDELDKLLLMQTAQGDMGSITLGQMAKLGGKVTAPAASFGGDYATRIAMSGALLQSSRKGFGSVDEAAAGLHSFVTDAQLHGKALSPKSFVRGADGVEKIADPAKLIGDIFRKTSGNISKLHALQFSAPAANLIGAYKEPFSEAFTAAKAGGKTDAQAKEEAAAAVEALIKTFVTANATMESEEQKRDAVLRTSGQNWDQAVTEIKTKLLEIKPSIDGFIMDFAKAAPAIAEAALDIAKVMVDVVGFFRDMVRGIKIFFDFLDFGKDEKRTGGASGGDSTGGKTGSWKRSGPNGDLQFVEEHGADADEEAPAGKYVTDAKGRQIFLPDGYSGPNMPEMPPNASPAGAPAASSPDDNQSIDYEALNKQTADAAENVLRLSRAAETLNTSLEQLGRNASFLNK